jgi:hypothetical protein
MTPTDAIKDAMKITGLGPEKFLLDEITREEFEGFRQQ